MQLHASYGFSNASATTQAVDVITVLFQNLVYVSVRSRVLLEKLIVF